ncbi:MAG: cell division protein CrgA [Acidimicrobiales bacterium]
MAKPQKRKVQGGRVTPKGTRADQPRDSVVTHTSLSAGKGPSPMWVPILMFALLGIGMLVILLNYVGLLPFVDGSASNWYLLLGLGLILGGIITATQYR